MKRHILISLMIVGASCFWSCNSLDIDSYNTLTTNEVFRSPAGIESVVATLYANLPIAAHNASYRSGHLKGDDGMQYSNWNNPSVLTGEALNTPLRVGMAPKSLKGEHCSWWDYGKIRYANVAIKELEANASYFESDQERYRHWLGEMYFCRAFMYAYMVKCYGGIPIVKEAKSYTEIPEEELYISRNTQKEVVDFVAEDLDKAMSLMGPDEMMNGRVNKYVAANLKARVMLFAASEAKNATVQLDGLVGIPASEMTEYYKKAYQAAQFAVNNNGKYRLYKKFDDGTPEGKTKNFWNLFIDETSSNTERMFVKEYDSTLETKDRPMNWNAMQLPHGFTVQAAECGELSVTTEWIELFEDINGDPFVLNVGTEENPVRYDKAQDLFALAQPRMRATILIPGTVMPGHTNPNDIYEVRKGIYPTYPGTPIESANYTDTYQGMTVIGLCGMGNTLSNGNGCIVWKHVDPTNSGAFWAGDTDWIEMRYAEVLLNKAEAAVNLIGEQVDGQVITMQDALDAINPIRERAGIPHLATVDEAKVIQERRCELAFENQLLWDFKRWRMFEGLLQNKTYHALYPYYVFDEQKYIFKKHNRTELYFTFDAKAYYAPIPSSAINRNPNLLPNNPGY